MNVNPTVIVVAIASMVLFGLGAYVTLEMGGRTSGAHAGVILAILGTAIPGLFAVLKSSNNEQKVNGLQDQHEALESKVAAMDATKPTAPSSAEAGTPPGSGPGPS